MSYDEEPNKGLMNNPKLLTAIIVGVISLLSIVGCITIFFIFRTQPTATQQATKVIQVTKIPTPTPSLTPVPSATKLTTATLDTSKASGGGGEPPTPDLTAAFINRPQSRSATISEIRGSVQMKASNGGDFATVTQSLTVPAGTTILTGEDSSAKITLTEGTIIRVGPQTQVKLEQLSGTTSDPVTKLSLDFGKVWSIVGGPLGTGTYDVQTPLGTASVIGSFMSIESNPTEGLDIMGCLEGKCKYTNDKGVQNLITLQQLIVKANTALGSPQKMDVVQVNDWVPTKITEVVTLTPTATATFTATGTRTPTGTRLPTNTPDLTATDRVQLTSNAGTATSAVLTSTASGNSNNQTATQNVINATNTMSALNLTSTASGNSLTAAALQVTANANATSFQLTQNVIGLTSTSMMQTAAAGSVPRVSISAPSSVSEGNYLTVTFNLSTAITQTTTISVSMSGGNGAQVGGWTNSVSPSLTDPQCQSRGDAVLQTQPSATGPANSVNFTASIGAGNNSVTMQIPICSDSITDPNDTLQFIISSVSPSNVQLGTPTTATVNVTDVAPASIGFNPVTYSVAENVSSGKVSLTVSTNSGPVSSNTTLNYSLTNQTATGGGTCTTGVDYVNTGGTVTILSGSSSATIDVPICYDSITEATETFQVNITNVFPVNGYQAGNTTASISIVDVAPPAVNFAQSSYTVNENNGKVDLTVQISPTLSAPATITYTASSGGATLDASGLLKMDGTGDFSARCFGSGGVMTTTVTLPCLNGNATGAIPIMIPANTASVTFSLLIADDAADEVDETFSVQLTGASSTSSPSPAIGSTGTTIVTIKNTTKPSISINNAAYPENNLAITTTVTTSRVYQSYLSNFILGGTVTGTVVTANYSTTAGTATGGGACAGAVDYVDASGTVTLVPGTTSSNIIFTVCGDTTFEPDENFSATLSAASNSSLGTSTATLTIMNDDTQPTITITSPATTIAEPGMGTSTAVGNFTIALSNLSQAPITINFSTSNGITNPATAGSDYSSGSGSVTIPALSLAGSINSVTHTVTVLADSIDENDETFTFNFSIAGGSQATLAPGSTSSTFTISPQNATSTKPYAFVKQPNTTLAKGGTTRIYIDLNKDSGKILTIQASVKDGAAPCSGTMATAPGDYTQVTKILTFAPGATEDYIDISTTSASANKCLLLKLESPINLNATPFFNNGDTVFTTITAAPDILLKAFFIAP